MTAIPMFYHGAVETLSEAWEGYKSMLIKWPNHMFDDITQIQIFRKWLQQQHKLLLDATIGGSLISKNVADAIKTLESMTLNDHKIEQNRGNTQNNAGFLELCSEFKWGTTSRQWDWISRISHSLDRIPKFRIRKGVNSKH
jgi:hypothetical protein